MQASGLCQFDAVFPWRASNTRLCRLAAASALPCPLVSEGLTRVRLGRRRLAQSTGTPGAPECTTHCRCRGTSSDAQTPGHNHTDLTLSPAALALAAAAGGMALAVVAGAVYPGEAAWAAEAAAEAVGNPCVQDAGDVNSLFVAACVVEFVGLTGAAVGGYLARVRKEEVERINAQLRQININLRKQARVESYAPSLSYAPVGTPAVAKAAAEVLSTVPAADPEAVPGTGSRGSEAKERVLQMLRAGKQQLRSANPAAAEAQFKQALQQARSIGDCMEEKKAARGVGTSLQRQKKYAEAIEFHKTVLDKSRAVGEHSGDIEALGAIADCYTEMGDLEMAAKYYDNYISHMEDQED